MESVLLFLWVSSFVAVVIIDTINRYQFKKNEEEYRRLLDEYLGHGFDIDIMTTYAVFFGSIANYQKIIWFVRLYKGVKMKFTRERYVQPEAYAFVQSLPDSRINWIIKCHRLYIIHAYIFTFWLSVSFAIFLLYK